MSRRYQKWYRTTQMLAALGNLPAWAIRLEAALVRLDPTTAAGLQDRMRAASDADRRRWDAVGPRTGPARLLAIAFDWKYAPEGFEHWRGLCVRLRTTSRRRRNRRNRRHIENSGNPVKFNKED